MKKTKKPSAKMKGKAMAAKNMMRMPKMGMPKKAGKKY